MRERSERARIAGDCTELGSYGRSGKAKTKMGIWTRWLRVSYLTIFGQQALTLSRGNHALGNDCSSSY